ncbi:MAG: hypothetical protein J6S85_02445 [Methanobrevibacter sp.]|nr:hypothetical protein [Methanobrevibacter sp.]
MTDYEFAIKSQLLKLGKKQCWLVDEVTKLNGGYVDASLISKTIKGRPGGSEKVRRAINTAIKIEMMKQSAKEENK